MADRIRTRLDWEDVRIFVALARHGSLSAAARALSVNHATVARRIASLEEALDDKLVERRPDGYALTPAGRRALTAADAMESAAASLSRRGDDESPAGLVRLSVPPSLAQGFLIERLAALALRHPGLDLEVATDLRNVSLERREADVALRLGRPQDGDVIARRMVGFGFGFYASAAWRRRLGEGAAPVFIGFDEAHAHVPEAVWLARHFPRARIAFRASHHLAQAVAARADAGIALLPHFVGRAERDLGACVLEHAPPARELWLVTRRTDRKDLAVRTVVGLLAERFAGEREHFE